MSPITFGGKPVSTVTAKTSPRQQTMRQVVDVNEPDRVVLFMRLVAMNCEARRDLRSAVEKVREIDIDALNDPELESHPQRPAMVAVYNDRLADERAATTRLIETNVSLERQWHQIPTADKHKYGLTFVVGETDPEANILGTLWRDDVGLALLVPFPPDWTPPQELSHRAFDTGIGVTEHTIREEMQREYSPF